MNVLVFGSDLITVGSLRHLTTCSAISHLELVTPTTNKKSPPIKFCKSNNISYHSVPKHIDFKLTNWNIPTTKHWDIGILVSFGYWIPTRIISSFPQGMLNMHPSLLPQYPGCAPIPYALLNGDKVTGVSIIDVAPKIDQGAILAQRLQSIDISDTFSSLSTKLSDLGGLALCDTITNLQKYRENSIAQKDNKTNIKNIFKYQDKMADNEWMQMSNVLHCDLDIDQKDEMKFEIIKTKKISKDWRFIDWRLPAKQILNRHRAITGLLRNSRCLLGTLGEDKLDILVDQFAVYESDCDVNIFDIKDDVGTVYYCKTKDVLFVKCGKEELNEYIGIKKLRIAPSQSSQHLANFNNFVTKFGHFVTHYDSKAYSEIDIKHMKNHF
eukprot:100088_1